MKTLDDVIMILEPYAAAGAAPRLPIDIVAIVVLARELKQLREENDMRQDPTIDEDRMMRCWYAWGICTPNGQLAEVTLDPAKAVVWRQGGHKIIGFVHEEPIAAPVVAQGELL